MTPYASSHMPPPAPLPTTEQDFAVRPTPRAQFKASLSDWLWRIGTFAPACFITLLMIVSITDWFAAGGVTVLETTAIILVGITFIWVSLSASTVLLGAMRLAIRARDISAPPSKAAISKTAILIPVYNESPIDVFGNALAMLKDLAASADQSSYTIFILSDTRDAEIAALEERAFFALRTAYPAGSEVYYRRRLFNADKKVGNLSDWITNWGAAYDAMLVLDADSLMSGTAIEELVRALEQDPNAGLIQSYPVLTGSNTLFGRMQQFASTVYGRLLAEGLASWTQNEGNYWGHNAVIRTRAFAESAKLPYLKRRGERGDLILSHDFVEAGLLRRAGWAVRFLPQIKGSYEETPQTVIDYAIRDRRWCRGNLQHLRLLGTRGFHPVTRFHLFQGAMAFLLSPVWLALIVIWSTIGILQPEGLVYFSSANPFRPVWPEASAVGGWVYFAVIAGMLLLPKVVGVLLLSFRRQTRHAYGGLARFYATAVFEIFCSVIFAPVLMVQQSLAVLNALTNRGKDWSPQSRGNDGYSWRQTLWFHKVEILLGAALLAAISAGYASHWLLIIVASLLGAAPISKISAARVDKLAISFLRLDAPQTLQEPEIVQAARVEREHLRTLFEDVPEAIAAE